MNKEQVYDRRISPLMTKVIAHCRKHNIAMLATFDIPTKDDEGLACTTHLPDETGKLPERIAKLAHIAKSGRHAPMMLTTERAGGSKTITAFID